MEDYNAKLQFEVEEKLNQNNNANWPKLAKILLGISLGIIVVLLVVIIYLAVDNSNLREKNGKNQDIDIPSDSSSDIHTDIPSHTDLYSDISSDEQTDTKTDSSATDIDSDSTSDEESDSPEDPVELNTFSYFGKIYKNLSYVENNVIYNSFKEGGENYKEDIGNINNGTDYTPNDRNMYDLYIPKYSERRKKEINGVILWIHGGAWIAGDKDQMDFFCRFYSQIGYISATIGYTILVPDQYEQFNIYKMIDEITACIKAIKKELIKRGFNGDKLRLAIGGYSAGSHLTLLYSYLINQNIIPLKFIIDMVGPIGLNMKYFQKLADEVEPFDNIADVNFIEEVIKEGKTVRIFPDPIVLNFMNLFLGNRYTSEDLASILDDHGNIISENYMYKDILKALKYADVTQVEDKNPELPAICVYGGMDDIVGVTAYAYLKNSTQRNLDFIYSKYEGHNLIVPNTLDGVDKISDISALIMEYSNKYFNE